MSIDLFPFTLTNRVGCKFGKVTSVVAYLVVLENQGIISGHHYINECHNFYSSAFGTVTAVGDLAKTAVYLVASIWNYPDHKLKQIFSPKNICILQILYLFVKDLLSACYKKNSPVEIQNWTSICPRFISQIRGPKSF